MSCNNEIEDSSIELPPEVRCVLQQECGMSGLGLKLLSFTHNGPNTGPFFRSEFRTYLLGEPKFRVSP